MNKQQAFDASHISTFNLAAQEAFSKMLHEIQQVKDLQLQVREEIAGMKNIVMANEAAPGQEEIESIQPTEQIEPVAQPQNNHAQRAQCVRRLKMSSKVISTCS